MKHITVATYNICHGHYAGYDWKRIADLLHEVGADIVGERTPTNHSIWKFVKRADGAFDIVNAAEGSYISPASSHNTALKTAAASPTSGWTLAPADAAGYVIIKSGSVQFNQTNNSTLGYKVYNWGGGTNIDDTGCKYVFEGVEYTPEDIENSPMPTPGVEYYIYSDTYHGGEFVNRYLYNNNGTLTLSTDNAANDAYKWTAASDGTYYTFTNKAGKYLGHKGMSDTPYNFTIAANASHEGVTLYSVGASRYFVVKNDGSKFDQSTITYDQTSGDWCTDFVFVPCNSNKGKVSLTVVSNTALADAVFTWNGNDITSAPIFVDTAEVATQPTLSLKSCNAAYKFDGFYSDAAYTTPLASATIESLTENVTIYAKFSLDVLTENYGEKWLRIRMYRDGSYTAGVGGTANGAAGTKSISFIIRELAITSSRTQYARANTIGAVQIVLGLILVGLINVIFAESKESQRGGKA